MSSRPLRAPARRIQVFDSGVRRCSSDPQLALSPAKRQDEPIRIVASSTIVYSPSLAGKVAPNALGRRNATPSVPLPTFASYRSTLGCERWKQGDTSKFMVLVRFWLRRSDEERAARRIGTSEPPH